VSKYDEKCPDCGSDPNEPDFHVPTCLRVGTCGQVGPPWLDPPFHRWLFKGSPPEADYDIAEDEQHYATMHPGQEVRRT
jgi:hypothetical protein